MSKIAFQFGGLTVHWYGVLVAAGFLAGLWTASRRGVREGLAPDTVFDLGPWVLVGAILGARIWFVVAYWQEAFAQEPWTEIFMVHHGGLVFHGGLLGGSAGCILYARVKKIPLWKLGDALAPSIALGQVFGRIGCLMNGCCYGAPTGLPWAVHYPVGHETHGAGVHPTQVYEAVLDLALFVVLARWYARKKFDGQVFALYLIAYAILRSVVEVFRGDYGGRVLGGWITPAHWVSVVILGLGLILWRELSRRAAKVAPGKEAAP